MPTNGMTIDSLNTVSSLTAQDEVPVWDKEASSEPTRKITAQNMANSVKSLASLPNTTEMNNAIAQSTADVIRTGDVVNDLTSTATDKPLSAAQGKALNDKIENCALKGQKRLGNNAQAVFTFESYSTSVIIFAASNNDNGALYVFSNGYLAPIKTATNISYALSSDYKTITVTNTTGAAIYVGCITTMYTPTIS